MWMMIWAVAFLACGDDAAEPSSEPDGSAPPPRHDAAIADSGTTCTLPSDCVDFTLLDMTTKACCSSSVACGYELPELDDMAKMDFPGTEDLIAELTAGDPNGRCAPLSFFFGDAPTLPERRVAVEEGDDILLTPDCSSYHVLAWGLPGCCLPDDSCGLSTDESYTTFANAIQGDGMPFDRPACLSADTLNQQFRDSVVLEAFARTVASGSCDYAALDARLAPEP